MKLLSLLRNVALAVGAVSVFAAPLMLNAASTPTLNHYSDYGVVEQNQSVTSGGINIANDPYGYSDQYTDSESGLQYLQVRYYDPLVMRFTQMDTYPLLNRYAYANENPIMNDDPSGHSAVGASSEKIGSTGEDAGILGGSVFGGIGVGLIGGIVVGVVSSLAFPISAATEPVIIALDIDGSLLEQSGTDYNLLQDAGFGDRLRTSIPNAKLVIISNGGNGLVDENGVRILKPDGALNIAKSVEGENDFQQMIRTKMVNRALRLREVLGSDAYEDAVVNSNVTDDGGMAKSRDPSPNKSTRLSAFLKKYPTGRLVMFDDSVDQPIEEGDDEVSKDRIVRINKSRSVESAVRSLANSGKNIAFVSAVPYQDGNSAGAVAAIIKASMP